MGNTKENTVDVEGFGVVAQSALFVRARFESIKSEILDSKFLSAAEFDEFVVEKAKKYFATAECKAIRCKKRNDFGIKGPSEYKTDDGAPLREEHLHALFLYTDFSALSTDFSATF